MLELSESAALPGGRYARTGFEPHLTFEVADRQWAAVQLYPGFFDIQQDVGSPDVIAVQFTTADAAFGANLVPIAVARPSEAVAALRANPTVAVVDAGPVSIAGQAGERVTVDAAGGADSPLLRTPPGVLSILPGRRLRLLLFVAGATVLAILVGGSVAAWARAEAAAQPVLDSIAIER